MHGNLVRKGDRRFIYDYRNRLVEVWDLQDNVQARYAYDVLDRRVHRDVAGQTPRVTVWDGWQAIEEYRVENDGPHLTSRRIYGRGLDEIVLLEQESAGSLDGYVPYYDALGNLALLTDLDAEIVERYEYSPLGKRRIFADSTPPEVTQIRWADGALHVELSEPVRQAQFLDAFATNASQLINLTQGDTLVTLDPPVAVGTGRDAGRHWILRPTEPAQGETDLRPQPGESLTLTLASTSLEDHFGNQPSGDLFQSLTWPTGEAVLADTTAPQLESVCVTADGRIEIVASEILDSATLSAITVDGGTTTWTPIGDGRAMHSAVLSPGNTTLDIPTTVTDLVGLGLAEGLNETFDVEAGQVAALFSRLPSGELATSTVGNPFGFKGLPLDEETGFYYVRRRYYDPELGRFITPDPYGYVDGPAMTAHAMNNPVSYSDPMGEVAVVDNLAGGAFSVGVGATLNCTIGQCDYSWNDAAIDFGLGFATSGLSSIGQLRHLRAGAAGAGRFAARAGIEVTLDVGAEWVRRTIRSPGDEIALGHLIGGGVLNLGIGEAGSSLANGLRAARNGVPASSGAPRIDQAAGGEFVGAGVRSVDQEFGAVSWGEAAAWQAAKKRGELVVNPNSIRYTQRSAGGGRPPRAPQLRESLAGGWDPNFGPIDVIRTPDGLLSLDNTRVAVAQELGLPQVTARVRGTDELLPSGFPARRLRSFENKAKKLGLQSPRTWGDLFQIRTMDNRLPATGTSQRPRMPGG